MLLLLDLLDYVLFSEVIQAQDQTGASALVREDQSESEDDTGIMFPLLVFLVIFWLVI